MILDGFPELWFDELLYSGLGRYRNRLRLPSEIEFMRLLFGSGGVAAAIEFPSRLEYLASLIPVPLGYSATYLINNHTLAPFYRPFLQNDRFELLCEAMLKGSNRGAHMLVGLNTSNVNHPKRLRYCSACAKEDTDQYGQPYWHRSHQLSDVIVCWKHGLF